MIYLIERTDKVDYDEFRAHVIVANTKEEVIELAKSLTDNYSIGEFAEVWDKAKITILGTYIGDKEEPFIVLSDYQNG